MKEGSALAEERGKKEGSALEKGILETIPN